MPTDNDDAKVEAERARIAAEWLARSAFYDWLVNHGHDPDTLATDQVLALLRPYERDQAAYERAEAAERERQRQEALAHERERQAREQLTTLLSRDEDTALCALLAWLRDNPRAQFTCTDAALRARLDVLTPGDPDPDAVAWCLVIYAGRYQLTLGSWRVWEERDEETHRVTFRRNVFDRDHTFFSVAERCARWATRATLLAEGASQAGADLVLVHDLTPAALSGRMYDAIHMWSERFNAPEPPKPPQPAAEDDEEPETPEPRTVAAKRRAVTPERLEERIRAFVKRFRKEQRRGPSKSEIRKHVTGADTAIINTVDMMVADGKLLANQGHDGRTTEYQLGDE
jgi:hypothetical protein